MSVISVIGTIVFFAVVALSLMAVMDVLFSPSRRLRGEERETARKPSSLAAWLAMVVPWLKIVARTKKQHTRR